MPTFKNSSDSENSLAYTHKKIGVFRVKFVPPVPQITGSAPEMSPLVLVITRFRVQFWVKQHKYIFEMRTNYTSL